MKKIIIAGISDFSSVMLDIISQEEYGQVVAFTLSNEYIHNDTFCNLPLLAFESLPLHNDMANTEILLTFGYSHLNAVREKMYNECKSHGYNLCTFVSKKAIFYSKSIDEGSIIMPNAYIGPYTRVGLCNIIWNGVNLSHHNTIGNFNNISPCAVLAGHVSVGSNCFIGVNSSFKNGIHIADKNLIGAGSYLSTDTEPNKVYVGSPAKAMDGVSAIEIIQHVE
jgi:sugar O-acyltransferase (sialic acid O-acetyltransferase NeuD family)